LNPSQPIQWPLLDLALTHPSVSSTANYEQLEFFGDAVVRLVASEWLMETYPQGTVGEYSAVRKVLVSDRILGEIASSYGFDRYLLIAPQAKIDLSKQLSRLADVLESVLGALYLSTHTSELVRPWLDLHWQPIATAVLEDPALQNYKDALQEITQSRQKLLPTYQVSQPLILASEDERFTAEVFLQGHLLGVGKGRSKKAAEQEAAKVAFFKIRSPINPSPEPIEPIELVNDSNSLNLASPSNSLSNPLSEDSILGSNPTAKPIIKRST